jgi:phosphoglucomutase
VSFGTSGHRGSPLAGTFTEAHILAITQAIGDYRREHGTDGLLYIGKDTHTLSGPAQGTVLKVLAAIDMETIIKEGNGVTPWSTPARTTPYKPRVVRGADQKSAKDGARQVFRLR